MAVSTTPSWQRNLSEEVLFRTPGPFTDLFSVSVLSLTSNPPNEGFTKGLVEWAVAQTSPAEKDTVGQVFWSALEPAVRSLMSALVTVHKNLQEDRALGTHALLTAVNRLFGEDQSLMLRKVFQNAIQAQVKAVRGQRETIDMNHIHFSGFLERNRKTKAAEGERALKRLEDQICGEEMIDEDTDAVLIDHPSAKLDREIELLKEWCKTPDLVLMEFFK